MTDSSNLTRIVQEVQPDEVCILGAQSHVAVSFEAPEHTADVDAMGTLRLLEVIRLLGLTKRTLELNIQVMCLPTLRANIFATDQSKTGSGENGLDNSQALYPLIDVDYSSLPLLPSSKPNSTQFDVGQTRLGQISFGMFQKFKTLQIERISAFEVIASRTYPYSMIRRK